MVGPCKEKSVFLLQEIGPEPKSAQSPGPQPPAVQTIPPPLPRSWHVGTPTLHCPVLVCRHPSPAAHSWDLLFCESGS